MTDDSDSSADKDKFVKRIEEILSDEMEDYSVVILSDYANEVEYGSPPIHIRETKLPKVKDGNEEVTVARKNIRDWVAKKYNVSGKDRITQGDRMYRHIMDHGTKPHPFIRPSIRDAENMKPADIMQMCEGENFISLRCISPCETASASRAVMDANAQQVPVSP